MCEKEAYSNGHEIIRMKAKVGHEVTNENSLAGGLAVILELHLVVFEF